MSGEAARESADLDPVVRAAVEARARQSGLSLSDYLTRLIHAPAHGYPTQGSLRLNTSMGMPGSGNPHDLAFWSTVPGETAGAGYNRLSFQMAVSGLNDPQPDLLDLEGAPAFVSPALRLVVVFNNRINGAALLMSAAFVEAAVPDFRPPARHSLARRRRSSWYDQIIDTCLDRSREVRNALVHRWTPTVRAERLALEAFVLLSDLTPARTELLQLCRYDRPRAFSELARHLDLVTDQLSLSANLLAEVEAVERPAPLTDEQRFADLTAQLLERAGGGVSLTEGAKLLGISRQALHKRVQAGSALGMKQGAEIVLPRAQFMASEGKTRLLDGLSKVVTLFEASKAGAWSALQFLIDPDPNLGSAPLDFLREGRIEAVENAARAYLGVDED